MWNGAPLQAYDGAGNHTRVPGGSESVLIWCGVTTPGSCQHAAPSQSSERRKSNQGAKPPPRKDPCWRGSSRIRSEQRLSRCGRNSFCRHRGFPDAQDAAATQ